MVGTEVVVALSEQQPDRTCQWEDYGEYDCEIEADETVTVMGKEIGLCASHARQYRSTQL